MFAKTIWGGVLLVLIVQIQDPVPIQAPTLEPDGCMDP